MFFIRSLVSKRCTYIVATILLLGKIMPIYSHYTEKKLVYITIITPFSHQPFSYIKCIKLNIRLFYNIKSVSNTEYIFFIFRYYIYLFNLS